MKFAIFQLPDSAVSDNFSHIVLHTCTYGAAYSCWSPDDIVTY